MRLGILSQTLELRIGGGALRAVTPPVALHCLWDKSQGIRVGVRDRGGDGVQMKKRPADSLPPSPLPNQFHLIHPSSAQKEWEERGEVRSSAGGENKRCWGGGGGVADVSSLTHQAEVCSLAHYKTLIKRGRGRRGDKAGGQVVRRALGGGGAKGANQKKNKNPTGG